jgi:4-amino-4-deoxy-L-arabinose transferase-like glycosyltransferase
VPRDATLAWTRAIPAWAWLTGIVVLSTVVRFGFGRRMIGPWIMIDELVYSELAKSLAEHGSFLIRDQPAGGAYGVVYPLLIAPAYLLFDAVPDAYAAAKAINGLLISLAAVPAYFLARRVLQPGLALLAAGLAVALPSMLYAGTLMTENAFYALFLCAVLALVLALERPSPLRVALLLAVVGIAFLTRAQAIVLVPALLTAPLLVVAYGGRRLREYRWLYGLPAALGALLLLAQLVRGRSLLGLLGAYRVTGEERYDVTEVARWLLYHVAELDLSLAVAPFAALLVLALVARRLEPRDRVFVAVSVSVVAWLLVQVAAFASRHSLRVEERNMFYVAPLFMIALLLWIERGAPRPRAVVAGAALAAAVLPALLPFGTLIGVSAVSDTFGLLPWWTVHEWGIPLGRLWVVVLLACSAAALAFAFVPARWALLLPALLLLFFAVTTQPVDARTRKASIGAVFQGITNARRDWVDRAANAEVAAIWTGRLDPLTVLDNEFFSRRVGRVFRTIEPIVPGGLAQDLLTLDRDTGRLLDPAGRPVRAPFVLVDDSLPVRGREIARDGTKGLSVVAPPGALQVEYAVEGTYDDGWSGSAATYRRYACTGGTLLATVESDAKLFKRPQRLVARSGRSVVQMQIPLRSTAGLGIPLHPDVAGRCVVRFEISPTAVPGEGDARRLGTHFRSFVVRP